METEEENQEVIDLKSVQLVKASYHEKVQPSVDELDYNSEGFESGTGSEVAIGRSYRQGSLTFSRACDLKNYLKMCLQNV